MLKFMVKDQSEPTLDRLEKPVKGLNMVMPLAAHERTKLERNGRDFVDPTVPKGLLRHSRVAAIK
jgi:hypothetical protein